MPRNTPRRHPARVLTLVTLLLLCPTTPADEDGFIPLFDGSTLDGWTTVQGGPVTRGWVVEDGSLHRKERGGHIVSTREFRNFELRFEWKVAPGGNSGVKYRLIPHQGTLWGCEYQLLDDERHPNAKNPMTRAGAMYQLVAPDEARKLNPAGEWNSARVVVNGPHLEHWLNGAKVLQIDVGSEEWTRRYSRSKYRGVTGFGEERPSCILLQDHGNEVWFREIKVRELTPE